MSSINKVRVELPAPNYSHMQQWFRHVGNTVMRDVKWHLHDGVEAVYCDPMGRRTPCRVLRVHNSMVTVEWESGNSGRVSAKRLGCPNYEESKTHFAMISQTENRVSLTARCVMCKHTWKMTSKEVADAEESGCAACPKCYSPATIESADVST